jgi:hypothetical protein
VLLPGLVPWQRQFWQSDIAQLHDSPWPQDEGRASQRYAVDELSQHCPGLAVLPLGHPPASFGIKHGPPPETVTTQISLAVQASQDATAMPPSGSVLPEPASTRHAQPPRSRVHVEVVALQVHSPLQQRSPGEQAPTPGVHAAPTTGSATQPASPADESDEASRELVPSTYEASPEPVSAEPPSVAESAVESVPPQPMAMMDATPSAKLGAKRRFAASTAFRKDARMGGSPFGHRLATQAACPGEWVKGHDGQGSSLR